MIICSLFFCEGTPLNKPSRIPLLVGRGYPQGISLTYILTLFFCDELTSKFRSSRSLRSADSGIFFDAGLFEDGISWEHVEQKSQLFSKSLQEYDMSFMWALIQFPRVIVSKSMIARHLMRFRRLCPGKLQGVSRNKSQTFRFVASSGLGPLTLIAELNALWSIQYPVELVGYTMRTQNLHF